MFAFFSRRLRRWLLLAVALPVTAWVLDRVGAEIEQRKGSSRVTRSLRGTGAWLHDTRRGRPRRPGW